MRTLVHTNGLTVQTSYHWPKPAGGIEILFAPLLRFVETRITGLTPEPIVLTNYYSQSYSAGNHNMFEEFVFEPRLEPGLPPATLAALNAANIQLLHISTFAARDYRKISGRAIRSSRFSGIICTSIISWKLRRRF